MFPYLTKIETPVGSQPIGVLKEGDTVCTLVRGGRLVGRKIAANMKYSNGSNRQLYEVHFCDGRKIQCTGDQCFLTSDGWRRINECWHHECEFLSLNSRGWAKAISIQRVNESRTLYRLVTSGELNYIANGRVVHCFSRLCGLSTTLGHIAQLGRHPGAAMQIH